MDDPVRVTSKPTSCRRTASDKCSAAQTLPRERASCSKECWLSAVVRACDRLQGRLLAWARPPPVAGRRSRLRTESRPVRQTPPPQTTTCACVASENHNIVISQTQQQAHLYARRPLTGVALSDDFRRRFAGTALVEGDWRMRLRVRRLASASSWAAASRAFIASYKSS